MMFVMVISINYIYIISIIVISPFLCGLKPPSSFQVHMGETMKRFFNRKKGGRGTTAVEDFTQDPGMDGDMEDQTPHEGYDDPDYADVRFCAFA